jgi:hypothetical protein
LKYREIAAADLHHERALLASEMKRVQKVCARLPRCRGSLAFATLSARFVPQSLALRHPVHAIGAGCSCWLCCDQCAT